MIGGLFLPVFQNVFIHFAKIDQDLKEKLKILFAANRFAHSESTDFKSLTESLLKKGTIQSHKNK